MNPRHCYLGARSSRPPLLEFSNISGGYGGAVIVRDISATIQPGQTLCVLGRNGVGKTTLVKLLTAHLSLRLGNVRFKDQDLKDPNPHQRQQIGISYAPQERSVFDNLSIRDNLTLVLSSPELSPYHAYFDAFPILKKRLDQKAGTLSGGEKKLLSFTRTMAEGNPLVILDEPTEGVQAENIEYMIHFIQERSREQHGFLIVEQNLSFACCCASDYLVMDQGKTIFEGKAAETSKSDLLKLIQV